MGAVRLFHRAVGHWYASGRRGLYVLNRKIPLIKTPLYVHWVSTYDCNLRCRHCEAGAGERTSPSLGTEVIARAVADMGRMGVRTLIITGGEPLLREDIFAVMALARMCGLKKIYLATNGGLVAGRERDLRRVSIDRVYINLDGLESSHDELRGCPGAFRQALDALRFFRESGVKRGSSTASSIREISPRSNGLRRPYGRPAERSGTSKRPFREGGPSS